ncbi:MAG TPA: type II/IV secretion system protein, partial [candidate division Zixibacteria bacterium]|nr:type II/IV secretion system protein [candidate division Zixibacteria bacterium]
KLGNMLVKMGFVTEDQITQALSEQTNIRHISLKPADVDSFAVNYIPEDIARKYCLIPVNIEGSQLIVAMDDPLNSMALDVLKFTSGMQVVPVIAARSRIFESIESIYTRKKLSEEGILRYADDGLVIQEEKDLSEQKLRYESKLAIAVKAVNMILIEAIKTGATDVHIEIDGDNLRVRYRIDGYLREKFIFPVEWHGGIVTRIKVMSDLDINERLAPQEGSCRIEYDKRDIDLLLSTIPTVQGENVSISVLVQEIEKYDLAKLGLSDDLLKVIQKHIERVSGLIIATGPTGSGKTTTIYSIIRALNTMGRKIVTIEDPVRYRFPIVNQVSIKPSAGLTFKVALDSVLRHDPEIIFIEELRDADTAELTVRAGLTGRLMMTTMHSADAASAPFRLIKLGLDPFLLADTIDLIIAQRLVRKLCPACKQEKIITIGGRKIRSYEAVGCKQCTTGYSGQTGVFEIIPGEVLSTELLKKNTDPDSVREAAREMGYRTMWESSISLVAKGITSLDEVRRALPADFSRYILTE